MKNIETPDKKHIEAIINDLRDGKYGIPDFQRDFEWSPREVNELIKSIFEDYYIGTLLLWKASSENIEYLSCKPIYGSEPARYEHIILDGQQRLSALYYAFFAPNKNFPFRKSKFYYYIDIEKLLDENYEEAFDYFVASKKIDEMLSSDQILFRRKIFPLKIFGEKSSHSWSRWLDKYEDFWAKEGNPEKARSEKEKLENIFDSIRNEYYISFIELDREIAVEKVCDIFQRINSTGLDLNIFDLLNALLRPKEIHLKSMWLDCVNELNDRLPDPEKGKIYLLQVISILKQGYCAPKYLYYLVPGASKPIKGKGGLRTTDTLVKNKDEFIDLWNLSVEITQKGLDKIQNCRDYGAIRAKFIPYPTMTPIFSALNYEKDKPEYANKKDIEEKIRKWYWASIFAKNYSSAVESQIQKDWSDVRKWFLADENVPAIVEQSELNINNLYLINESQQGSAIYRAIFNILILNEARDWENFNLPEYSNLEDHHIVPKSWGKRNHINKINSILNRTPLADLTNKHVIGDKLPNKYLADLLRKLGDKEALYKLMKTHLISRKAVDILMKADFSEKDFEEFLDEREKTIKAEIKKLLGINDDSETGLFQPNKPYSNKILIRNLIKNSYKYIDWVDKYFSSAGLEMIAQAIIDINKTDLDKIRIITSIDKVNLKLREIFMDLRDELKNMKVNIEMKVIVDKNIKSMIHDRWFITEGKIFNIPSTDTMAVGQYSEIKETINQPPFENWWNTSLDIIYDWNEIKKLIDSKSDSVNLFCQGKGATAKGIYYNDGRMKVLKDSTAVIENSPTFIKHNYKKIKDALIANNLLKIKGKYFVFVKDHEFDSPSAAAAVILGRSASGPEEWKDETGKTLKEIV